MSSKSILVTLFENYKKRVAQNRKSPYWAFFKSDEDRSLSHVEAVRCIVCSTDDDRRGRYVYKHENGCSNLKSHSKTEHAEYLNDVKQHMNHLSQAQTTDYLQKRAVRRSEASFPNKRRSVADSYPVDSEKQRNYENDIANLVCKGLCPLSITENPWFRQLVSNIDPRLQHPSRKKLTHSILKNKASEIMEQEIKPLLESAVCGSVSIDLWMSCTGNDIFGLIFSLVTEHFKVKEVTLGLVKSISTCGTELMKDMKKLLDDYGLSSKLIAVTLDGGSNLHACKRILSGQVDNPVLDFLLDQPCVAHILSNACKKAIASSPLIGEAKKKIQRCITYTKKSGKGANLLRNAQENTQTPARKLVADVPTRFASVMAMFKSALENRDAINHMFSSLVPQDMRNRLPSQQNWDVILMSFLSLKRILSVLLLSQSSASKWTLSDALVTVIELYISLKDPSNTDEAQVHLNELCDDHDDLNWIGELESLNSDIKEAVANDLFEFLSPYREFDETRSQFWTAIMLDSRYKKCQILLRLQKADHRFQVRQLIKEYEDRIFFPALCRCYHLLHHDELSSIVTEGNASLEPNVEPDFDHYNPCFDEDEQVLIDVKREYKKFRSLAEIPEDSYNLIWFETYNKVFPTLSFFARQIFSICPSQISVERLFSVSGLLTSNRRNRLGIDNLNNIVRINKADDFLYRRDADVDSYLEEEAELITQFEEERESMNNLPGADE